MAVCHGQGAPDDDGCCYVGGSVCPLRLAVVDGQVVRGAGEVLGTVEEWLDAAGIRGRRQRDAVTAAMQGVAYACGAAVDVLLEDPRRITDRAAFEAAWDTHPGYVEHVRPAWAALEARLGLPDGAYQCSTWTGTGNPECCYAEDAATNDARVARLHPDLVALRSGRSRPS